MDFAEKGYRLLWAPVMRLAAESDPVAFTSFVRELEQVPVAAVPTRRLLIED